MFTSSKLNQLAKLAAIFTSHDSLRILPNPRINQPRPRSNRRFNPRWRQWRELQVNCYLSLGFDWTLLFKGIAGYGKLKAETKLQLFWLLRDSDAILHVNMAYLHEEWLFLCTRGRSSRWVFPRGGTFYPFAQYFPVSPASRHLTNAVFLPSSSLYVFSGIPTPMTRCST